MATYQNNEETLGNSVSALTNIGNESTLNQSGEEDNNDGFSLVEARKHVFNKFPAELKCLLVYRHFYTDLDEEASQLSLQWFALLISYFCSLCRLEGRRVQYTQNGNSERFGSEFAKAHHRASILFERVTGTYRKILSTYNMRSEIKIRKKEGPKVIKEMWKVERQDAFGNNWRYTNGAVCDVEKHIYDVKPAFLYALDELRFYEEFVNFTIQILKLAFADERLQTPIVEEVTLLFRSNSFNFQHNKRLQVVNKTKKALAEAQGADSILHNCHRLAARLVAPPEPVPLKLALLQRSPFIASSVNHPLLSQLNYQRSFARKEITPPLHPASLVKQAQYSSTSYHVRLREGEESPHRKEIRELNRETRELQLNNNNHNNNKTDGEQQQQSGTPLGKRKKQPQQQRATSAGSSARKNSPTAEATSKEYWNRVATTKQEAQFTCETHQPMFAPSHRALSSLTPVGVVRARQQSAQQRQFSEAKDKILTKLPPDSILPRLVDFDRPDRLEEEGFLLPERVDSPIDHATSIIFNKDGRGAGPGRAMNSFLPLTMSVGGVMIKTGDENATTTNKKKSIALGGLGTKRSASSGSGDDISPKKSLMSRFSTAAKKIATATGVRTNTDHHARSTQKAFDRLVTQAAASTPMSAKTRALITPALQSPKDLEADNNRTAHHVAALTQKIGAGDPSIYFIAPLDPETGKEDFTLYNPTEDIDAVYQQLAHGVQLSHFEVPLDIEVVYDNTGLLVADE